MDSDQNYIQIHVFALYSLSIFSHETASFPYRTVSFNSHVSYKIVASSPTLLGLNKADFTNFIGNRIVPFCMAFICQ